METDNATQVKNLSEASLPNNHSASSNSAGEGLQSSLEDGVALGRFSPRGVVLISQNDSTELAVLNARVDTPAGAGPSRSGVASSPSPSLMGFSPPPSWPMPAPSEQLSTGVLDSSSNASQHHPTSSSDSRKSEMARHGSQDALSTMGSRSNRQGGSGDRGTSSSSPFGAGDKVSRTSGRGRDHGRGTMDDRANLDLSQSSYGSYFRSSPVVSRIPGRDDRRGRLPSRAEGQSWSPHVVGPAGSYSRSASGKGIPSSKAAGDGLPECRICLLNETPEDMVAPCGCNGSLKYTHKECLKSWVAERRRLVCELCSRPYREDLRAELERAIPEEPFPPPSLESLGGIGLGRHRNGGSHLIVMGTVLPQRGGVPSGGGLIFNADTPATIVPPWRNARTLWSYAAVLMLLLISIIYQTVFSRKNKNKEAWMVYVWQVLMVVLPIYLVLRIGYDMYRYRMAQQVAATEAGRFAHHNFTIGRVGDRLFIVPDPISSSSLQQSSGHTRSSSNNNNGNGSAGGHHGSSSTRTLTFTSVTPV